MPGSVIKPETEDMNTTRPWPSRIFGSTAWVTPIWAVTLTSSCRDKSSRDKPSTGPFTMMPALFTTPFSAAGSRSARPAMACRSVMSSGIACTLGMRSRLWSASADRAVAYTSHPRPLMRSVMARPIPRPAPVTSTEGGIVFSFRKPDSSLVGGAVIARGNPAPLERNAGGIGRCRRARSSGRSPARRWAGAARARPNVRWRPSRRYRRWPRAPAGRLC